MCEQRINHTLGRYTGAGFQDVSAPASEAPEADMERISEQAEGVALWLGHYGKQLEALRMQIAEQNRQGLLTLLQHMQTSGQALAGS